MHMSCILIVTPHTLQAGHGRLCDQVLADSSACSLISQTYNESLAPALDAAHPPPMVTTATLHQHTYSLQPLQPSNTIMMSVHQTTQQIMPEAERDCTESSCAH